MKSLKRKAPSVLLPAEFFSDQGPDGEPALNLSDVALQELARARLLRIDEDVAGLSLLNDAAVRHEDHPVGHFAREGNFVRDDDHGEAFLREVADGVEDLKDRTKAQSEKEITEGELQDLISDAVVRSEAKKARR